MSRPTPAPSSEPSRRSVFWRRAALAAVACAAAAGCGTTGANSDATSIFQIMGPPSPQEAAAWAADPFDPDKRQRGLLLLANAPWGGDPVYVDFYADALDDEDAGVRTAAVRALRLHGSPRHAERIAALMLDDDDVLRLESARALQRIHAPEVVPMLVGRLDAENETHAGVRAAAATALGQYRSRLALDALVTALGDRALSVNLAARGSLETLTGETFGLDAPAWLAFVMDEDDPFASGERYVYPVYERDRRWYEWIAPWSQPPNEVAGSPAGMPGGDTPRAAAPPGEAG